MHSLLHFVDDVKKFGHLESFSAFRFENYLRSLSSKIKPCGRELQQLGRRMSEEKFIKIRRVDSNVQMYNQFDHDHQKYYKSLKCEWHLVINNKDNYVILKDRKFCKMVAFFKENDRYMFLAKVYTNDTSAYNTTIDSKTVFRYCKVHDLSESDSTFAISDIEAKCIFLEFEGTCYLIPLLPKS